MKDDFNSNWLTKQAPARDIIHVTWEAPSEPRGQGGRNLKESYAFNKQRLPSLGMEGGKFHGSLQIPFQVSSLPSDFVLFWFVLILFFIFGVYYGFDFLPWRIWSASSLSGLAGRQEGRIQLIE